MSKLRNGKLNQGDRVEVYRNLHNNTFSVRLLGAEDKWDTKRWRDVGKVVKHLENWMTLRLENVKFSVQPAGQAKVRREGKKNVHAFVRGTVAKSKNTPGFPLNRNNSVWVTYNPYQNEYFTATVVDPETNFTSYQDVHEAKKVTLTQGYVYAAL